MRKVVLVLALIACDCLSRDVLVHGDPIRKPEAAGRNDDYEYQKEPRGRFADFDTEVSGGSLEDREQSSEPIGRWRNNGEALEPKWRDGDSVPLLPFSHFQPYSKDGEVDDAEEDGFPEAGRRPFKHRYALNQSNRPRGSSDRRLPTYDYEAAYRDDTDEDYSRRRRRPLKDPRGLTFPSETIEGAASNDGKRGNRNFLGDSLNDKEVTSRYREAFQAREYEHELSDEEYSKPRPRKRRPPQNYEFALANEAPRDDDESRNSSGTTSSRLWDPDEHRPTPQPSSNDRENTLELKMLLKMQQEEGSSLSEILQRRNLTLADLLKGKADVINALKSRNADESYEYIEEMSRAMSDSLMKLATTATPTSWGSTTRTSVTPESVAIKPTSASSISDNLFTVTVIPDKYSKSYDQISSNDTSDVKEESEDTEIATQPVRNSSLPKATTIASAVIKTSTSPPIVTKSIRIFLNNDSNAGLTSDRAAKLGNFDEEEIMEFSDFTDFKKSKNSGAPAWVGPPSEVAPSQPPRDTESTLSIEQILNPTERTGHARSYKNDRSENNEDNEKETFIRDESQSVRISEPSAEEYDTYVETEYQNDTPIAISEDDDKQDEMNDDAVLSLEKTKETANPVDNKKQSFDNYSTMYQDASQSGEEKTRDRALDDHGGDTGSRRYEEVVSEIEPEARAEIFELFASGSAGKRLERLLKSRNMSLEELIALRQRGSSKVHLTEVSRLRIPKPKNLQTLEQTSSTNNGEVTVALSPVSNSDQGKTEKEDRRESDRTTNRFKQNIASYPLFDENTEENGSMSRLLDLVRRDGNASTEATFSENGTLDADGRGENPHRTMQIVDLLTTFGSLPFAKNVQRQLEAEIDNNEERAKVTLYNVSVAMIDREKTVRSDNSTSEFHQVGSVEEIVREEPNTIDIKMIYDETMSKNNGQERKTLSKIKPSIIASGAILGVALVVFLAIFIVCRIKQKQRYTYRNTLSRAVFQGPVMAARKLSNSSSLSTVMVNVVATSTTKRPDRPEMQEANFAEEFDDKSDMDNDSLDANDSWETIPDYAK